MYRPKSVRLAVAVLFIAAAPWLAAQITTTTITGTVTDPTGAAIPNAQVTAANTGTNLSRSAQTGGQGEFRIEFLPVGSYNVEITAQGFKKFVRSGLVLEVNVPARVDAVLQIGGMAVKRTGHNGARLVKYRHGRPPRSVRNSCRNYLPLSNRRTSFPLSFGYSM